MVRVDDLVLDHRPIDVLKIDVEGADFCVLLGCQRLLERKQIGTIFFEENLPRLKSIGIVAGEARRFLESYGYKVRVVSGHNPEFQEFVAVAP